MYLIKSVQFREKAEKGLTIYLTLYTVGLCPYILIVVV